MTPSAVLDANDMAELGKVQTHPEASKKEAKFLRFLCPSSSLASIFPMHHSSVAQPLCALQSTDYSNCDCKGNGARRG